MNVSSLTSTSATRPVGPPPGPPPGGAPEKTMKAVADTLGLDPEELKKALEGGSTMSSLAAQSGITQEDLVATIAATLPAQGPDGATIDTTSMATGIANGTRPERPPQPEVDHAQGIEALCSALGIRGSDLLDRFSSGTGISDLLAQNPRGLLPADGDAEPRGAGGRLLLSRAGRGRPPLCVRGHPKAWIARWTASARPATAMTLRSAVCGARRTTRGPRRPPIRQPIASGSAADQATDANRT
jgi:hypothetical protein